MPAHPAIPPDLLQERPVPWQPALGSRNGPLSWLEYGLARGGIGIASRLPLRIRRRVIAGVARVTTRIDRRHSDAARRFLRQALGDLPALRRESLVRAAYANLLEILLSTGRLERTVPRERILEHFTLNLHPDVQRVVDAKRGAIVVSPHVGHWEAATVILPRIGFDPLYAIVRPPKNRPLSCWFQRVRDQRGLWQIPRRGALTQAMAVLRARGSLALIPDQRSRLGPVTAPFFGRPTLTEQAPALLMRRARVPLVVGACYHTEREDRFELTLGCVLWPEDERGKPIEETAARINAEMEERILERPEQYHWIHDRYRSDPREPGPAPATAGGHRRPAEPGIASATRRRTGRES